jgi:hypothetical protein
MRGRSRVDTYRAPDPPSLPLPHSLRDTDSIVSSLEFTLGVVIHFLFGKSNWLEHGGSRGQGAERCVAKPPQPPVCLQADASVSSLHAPPV